MNTNFLKTWLLAIQTVFLTVVKKAIKIAKAEAIASAKTYTDNTATSTLQSAKSYTDQEIATLATSVGSITGGYKGAFPTKAAMDAVTAKAGDWAILSVDDGANESGIYVKGATNFTFVLDIAAFSEIKTEILASDAEFETGTSTEKTATVKQIKDALTAITTQLADYALENGNVDNHFLVKDAEVNTKQAVNASQFDFTFTEAEAQAAWDAINVDEPAYNFDVTGNWAGKNVTSSATFLSYLVNTCGSPDATVSDFSLVGDRLRAIVTNCPNIFLKNMDLKSTDFKVPNYSGGYALLDISENNLSLVQIDAIADFALANLPSLSTWKSFDNTQPTESKKTAINDLCASNDGSAFFSW